VAAKLNGGIWYVGVIGELVLPRESQKRNACKRPTWKSCSNSWWAKLHEVIMRNPVSFKQRRVQATYLYCSQDFIQNGSVPCPHATVLVEGDSVERPLVFTCK
jgi:hypothetical protein